MVKALSRINFILLLLTSSAFADVSVSMSWGTPVGSFPRFLGTVSGLTPSATYNITWGDGLSGSYVANSSGQATVDTLVNPGWVAQPIVQWSGLTIYTHPTTWPPPPEPEMEETTIEGELMDSTTWEESLWDSATLELWVKDSDGEWTKVSEVTTDYGGYSFDYEALGDFEYEVRLKEYTVSPGDGIAPQTIPGNGLVVAGGNKIHGGGNPPSHDPHIQGTNVQPIHQIGDTTRVLSSITSDGTTTGQIVTNQGGNVTTKPIAVPSSVPDGVYDALQTDLLDQIAKSTAKTAEKAEEEQETTDLQPEDDYSGDVNTALSNHTNSRSQFYDSISTLRTSLSTLSESMTLPALPVSSSDASFDFAGTQLNISIPPALRELMKLILTCIATAGCFYLVRDIFI